MDFRQDIKGPSPYGALLVVVLAAGWLLPNHYPPWNTFHSSAWVASALTALAFWQLANDSSPVRLSRAAVFLAATALIPWAQYAAGIVALPSAALLDSLYLVGLAAAFVLGEHWDRAGPRYAAGAILVAACMASVASVGLQTYQWLGLAEQVDLMDFWIFPNGSSRPVANIGQPNQLASLLLWGLLGAAWAWHKGWIGRVVATAVAAFILFGVALTESRTACVTLTAGILWISIWRPDFLERNAVRWAQALYAGYLACLFGLAPLGRAMGLQTSLTVLERTAGEVRWSLWRLALDAASQRPWEGFGWNQFNAGFLAVFPKYPAFIDWYAEQSHNLALDLIVWVGWPLALVLLGCVAIWLRKVARTISDTEQFLTVAALGVMLVHAMLELPLHYGYFLWPFGVLAGSASARLSLPQVASVARRGAVAFVCVLSVLVGLIVHDYFALESAFVELRFQLLHIGRNHDERPPQTFLLTDWTAFVVMSRTVPKPGMSDAQISKWEALMLYNTSPLAFRKVVGALVLNGRSEEAKYWADRYCAVISAKLCKGILNEWVAPAAQPTSP
jgi:hypothetical protein